MSSLQEAELRGIAKTLRWTRRATMIAIGVDLALAILYVWKVQ